jgi:hypothetical protein
LPRGTPVIGTEDGWDFNQATTIARALENYLVSGGACPLRDEDKRGVRLQLPVIYLGPPWCIPSASVDSTSSCQGECLLVYAGWAHHGEGHYRNVGAQVSWYSGALHSFIHTERISRRRVMVRHAIAIINQGFIALFFSHIMMPCSSSPLQCKWISQQVTAYMHHNLASSHRNVTLFVVMLLLPDILISQE